MKKNQDLFIEVVKLVSNYRNETLESIMEISKDLEVSYSTVWKILKGYNDFSENILNKIKQKMQTLNQILEEMNKY